MKYYNFDIVFQEIPNETTLAINITNCPNHCQGCHSPHLWKDVGKELTTNTIDSIIAPYAGRITCVCLMGGDNDVVDITHLAKHLHQQHALKVGWYSGQTKFPAEAEHFNYVKLGPFIPEKGGLKSSTTNQRLYQRVNGEWKDITSKFWK